MTIEVTVIVTANAVDTVVIVAIEVVLNAEVLTISNDATTEEMIGVEAGTTSTATTVATDSMAGTVEMICRETAEAAVVSPNFMLQGRDREDVDCSGDHRIVLCTW